MILSFSSFFHLMLSTGRAAGTVSCAAPSTIGLTMRRSWTMSAALQEATPSRFTWFLKVISRWWPPHCTAILQNYWLFSTCKYWRWSCETISIINIHSSLCDASLLSKRSGNVAPMLNFFFLILAGPDNEMARCCCRNRRCVGRFGVIEWKPPRVPGSHAWDGVFAPMAKVQRWRWGWVYRLQRVSLSLSEIRLTAKSLPRILLARRSQRLLSSVNMGVLSTSQMGSVWNHKQPQFSSLFLGSFMMKSLVLFNQG